MQGFLIEGSLMNNIKEAAEAFCRLTRFQYDFTIGRKGVKREFRLDFEI